MDVIWQWINDRLPIKALFNRYLGKEYLVPKNLNILYCFGVLAVFIIASQFLSGFWLSMFYTPTIESAFASVQIIMRDVNFGWLFRYLHTTGASALFIILYVHIFRGLLYGSYQKPRELVWLLGVLLFVCIIVESTCGYLLPWGQMSYWSMQVISSIFGVIPFVGEKLVMWIRGDFVVGAATLQRCYVLHIIGIPLILLILTLLHIVSLRHVGSNNPAGIDVSKKLTDRQVTPFYPKYMLKDLLAVGVFLLVFFTIVFFFPDMHGYFIEENNYLPANIIQSPDDIKPLWYLMPFYGILKVIPNKALGVFLMLSSIFCLFLLPWLDKSTVRSMRYKGAFSKLGLVSLVLSFIGLGFSSMQTLTTSNIIFARLCIGIYFASFLLMPIYTKLEKCKQPPLRID